MKLSIVQQTLSGSNSLTLKSWTPMQANMNCSRVVTIMMFPMVLMATNTHWTTCWNTHTTRPVRRPLIGPPSTGRSQKKPGAFNHFLAVPTMSQPVNKLHAAARWMFCGRYDAFCRYLESFGSVDGPQRSEHSQDSQDLHH